jgi:hypothetical protein
MDYPVEPDNDNHQNRVRYAWLYKNNPFAPHLSK